MASQHPEVVSQSQPHHPPHPRQSHGRSGPYLPIRNIHCVDQGEKFAQDAQNYYQHSLPPYGRPDTGFLPFDSSSFQLGPWDCVPHNSHEDLSEDNYGFSCISTPSGAAPNGSPSSAGSWKDGNVGIHSTRASMTGSPTASYLIPLTQPLDISWMDSIETHSPNPLSVVGCSGGAELPIPDILVDSIPTESNQECLGWTLINRPALPTIDSETQDCFGDWIPPMLELDMIPSTGEEAIRSIFEYQNNSSSWETHRDITLDCDFPSSSNSISSNIEFADLDPPMENSSNTARVDAEENLVPLGKTETRHLEWQQVLVSKPDSGPARCKKKRQINAKRHGPLEYKVRKNAGIMRSLGACLNCRKTKSTCSSGDVCKRCIDKYDPIVVDSMCVRDILSDHFKLFFPQNLVSHLQHECARQLYEEIVLDFVKEDITVEVTPGRGFSTLRLSVAIFLPKNERKVPVPIITSNGGNSSTRFQDRWPPPVALKEKTMKTLIRQCHNQVTQMVELKQDISQIFGATMNPVSQEIMKAIYCYYKFNCRHSQVTDLGRAITLFAMFLSMDRIFTFTRESSQLIFNKIGCATNPTYHYRSMSRLLNRQIKTAINLYLERETRMILMELNARLKERNREFWALDFSVCCILCLCIEEVENGIDLLYVEKPGGPSSNNADFSSSDAENCEMLDQHLFGRIKKLFHSMYQTGKLSTCDTKWLNPIRDGAKTDMNSKDLVEDIQRIMLSRDEDMRRCASMHFISVGHKTLVEHMDFRKANSGRLLSRFLLSFKN